MAEEEFHGNILNHSLMGFRQQPFRVTTSVLLMEERVDLLNSFFQNKCPQESVLRVTLIFLSDIISHLGNHFCG